MNRILRHRRLFAHVIVGLAATLGFLRPCLGVSEATALAIEIRLTPEALIVADVDEHAVTILQHLRSAADVRTSLAAAKAQTRTDRVAVRELSRQVLTDPSNSEAATALEAAKTRVLAGDRAIEDIHHQLFLSVSDSLAEDEKNRLLRWWTASKHDVPAEFRVLSKTEQEWKAIEAALRREKACRRVGEALCLNDQALLAQIRNEPDVISARQRLLTEIRGVIDTFRQFSD